MELETLARAVSHELKRQGLMLVTAESCTGGWLAQIMTSVAGSSEWFERGFVAYTNLAKREMLGVKTTILSRYGAVSEQAARAMAEGALTHSH
ncbi:MAG: nicotinamide-nucleotide amidohydrolase family protein, partial [Gammaproteobacteria bacterium]|nr:nicotinamide-nucleotide amidohydrolase family protein [Gammaproteobacteria bacterium]